jgi:hypothetical protein
MHLKFQLVSMLTAASVLGYAIEAQAQNTQQWLTNSAGQIQADYGSGAINQQQAGRLQQGTARILGQEQQDMARNGGFLTPQQQGQIGQEIHGLNRHLNRDVGRNTGNTGILNGQYYGQQGYPNNGQYYANQGYPPGYGYNQQGVYPNQPAPGSAQWQQWQQLQAMRQQQALQNGQYNQQGYPVNQGQFQHPFFHHWQQQQ